MFRKNMFRKKQARVLVQAVCFHCGHYNEYYRHPDEPSICQGCGRSLPIDY